MTTKFKLFVTKKVVQKSEALKMSALGITFKKYGECFLLKDGIEISLLTLEDLINLGERIQNIDSAYRMVVEKNTIYIINQLGQNYA